MSENRTGDERVAALETNVGSLAKSVESLAKSVEIGFSDTRRERTELHSENQRALRALESKISDQQRTPWATLAGWAAVVITLILGVGSIVANGMQRSTDTLDARIDGLESTRLESSYQRGANDARVDDLTRRVLTLEAESP